MKDGGRVRVDEGVRDFVAADFRGGIASGGEYGDPFLGIVGIGCQHVDGVVLEQPSGGASHAISPESGERGAGHLDHATLLRPLQHKLWTLAQNWVALGMGDYGGDAAVAELRKTIRSLLGHAVITQLDQHVLRCVDGVAGGIGEDILHIVVGEMEVAAQTELQRIAYLLLQLGNQGLKIVAVVVVAIVGVWSGNLVRDAVGGGHAAHGDGGFPGLGAVVYFRKNMGMNVDHDL